MILQLILAVLIGCAASSVVTAADFLFQPYYTTNYIWNNYVGIVLNLDEVQPIYNTSTFQSFILNSNLKGDWNNNFMTSLRMPKGWFYNCSEAGVDPNSTNCTRQLTGNNTFMSQLGQFVWNTQLQPFWTFGINTQMLNLTNSTIVRSLAMLIANIYVSTHNVLYQVEMMTSGDLSVQNGMRTSMSPTIFLNEAAVYQRIIFGVSYKAPGVSQYAGGDWVGILPTYFTKVNHGIFTFQPIIFTNASLCNISNLLSDNYTKGYLSRRFKVNNTFTFTTFSNPVTLERIRIVDGEGIDGVTNTLAAAIWWIDFVMESARYGLKNVALEGARHRDNFQSVFGSPPNFTPTSLYIASIFSLYAIQEKPRIVIPSITTGTSSKIKVWGFQTAFMHRFLIINKDQNPTLNGVVNLLVKSKTGNLCTCIYLQAPRLESKSDEITFGGHYFTGASPIPQGSYQKFTYDYNVETKGYQINIKYAQVAACEISNSDVLIPTKPGCFETSLLLSIALMVVALLF